MKAITEKQDTGLYAAHNKNPLSVSEEKKTHLFIKAKLPL